LPGYDVMPNRQWELLRAGQQMAREANVPLLIVNEPIYVGSGENSDVNYNSFYERALYDRFRTALTTFTQQHAMSYLDLWNLLPPENFSNTSLHYNAEGNRRVADEIMKAMQSSISKQ
ncbi:MAG TPA: SGNH/GDSL hydrolase family protein, partial [Anaerolineae bacterium]|nr:SGNH/GDSL hydrolase family protein [Anaerolineae bacterium]